MYERHRSGSERYVNNDGKRNIAGDFVLQVKPVYRSGTKKRIGREIVHVTLIRQLGKNNALFRVTATFVLGAGKIEAAGSSTFKHLSRGAAFTITGGTGDYAGASGSVNVREANRRTFFTFLINTKPQRPSSRPRAPDFGPRRDYQPRVGPRARNDALCGRIVNSSGRAVSSTVRTPPSTRLPRPER